LKRKPIYFRTEGKKKRFDGGGRGKSIKNVGLLGTYQRSKKIKVQLAHPDLA